MVENREFVDNMEAQNSDAPERDVIAEQITIRSDVREGMEARDSTGAFAGGVREVRATHFLLDRPMARDIWVPFSAVAEVSGDLVHLNVADVNAQDWEKPPLLGNAVE